MNKKLLIILILITMSVVARAQRGIISDVTFSQQESGKIKISYWLDLQGASEIRDVKAYITIEGRQIQCQYVSGDVGTVSGTGLKIIGVDFFRQFDDDMEANISFQVKGDVNQKSLKPIASKVTKSRERTFSMEYVYSPTAPYGFTLAYCGKWWGGYANFKYGKILGLKLKHPASLEGYQLGDRAGYSRLDLIMGPVFRAHRLVCIYAGIGYGHYEVARNYTEQKSYGNYPSSYDYIGTDRRQGMAYEVGVRVVLGKIVSISGGYNGILGGGTPAFSDFHVGLGFTF